MAICLTEDVGLYKIDREGKLIEIMKFRGDFAQELPSVNHCKISDDNTLFATGGDDKIIRIYPLNKEFKKEGDKKVEIDVATASITGIDINRDNSLMVATSKDGFAYMINLSTRQVIQKLSFKNQPTARNFMMRACIIRRYDNAIYTLAIQA